MLMRDVYESIMDQGNYNNYMLTGFISDLRTALLIFVFLGFVVFGTLIIAIEWRYLYLKFLEERTKHAKLLYYAVVFLTLILLAYLFNLFFKSNR